MTDDLVTWLRAQLDAIEGVARTGVGAHDWRLRDFARLILRDVEAKRKILDLTRFEAQFPDSEGGYDSACEDVIKLLALPFADRPGYQEDWRP